MTISIVSNEALSRENVNSLYAPGLKGWPIYGVLPTLRRDPLKFLTNMVEKHGSVFPMKIGPHRVILAGHPNAVEHVCRANAKNYEKTRFVEKLKPIMGEGVATVNGAAWEKSRRVIQPMLKQNQIDKLIADMDDVITTSINSLVAGKVNDLNQASFTMALKVICRTMFGNDNAESAEHVVEAMEVVQTYISDSIWEIFPFRELLGTKDNVQFKKSLQEVTKVIGGMIEQRRDALPQADLLQALVDAINPETGEKFSNQQVFDEVMTIFIAGHETTASTLTWLWQLLGSRPDLQDQIREEVLANIPLDTTPKLEDLMKLKFTQAVLKETMRLYPSAWWFARTAVEDDEIMGVPVRAGDSIMVSEYVTHRLGEFWKNPDTFDHRRFLDAHPTHKFAYIPFGAGPRTCPGGHFAMAEMLLAISRMITRFELKKTRDVGYQAFFTLRPHGGMPIELSAWKKTIFFSGVEPKKHALSKSILKMRREVFVGALGWNLKIDEDGCEMDEFDTHNTQYGALISEGQIKCFSRQLSPHAPTLLYNVFPYLIEDPDAIVPSDNILEGSRFAVNPNVEPAQSNYWCREYLLDLMEHASSSGIDYIYTVSDPVLERVLRKAGLKIDRLGGVKTDPHGVKALALKLYCKIDYRGDGYSDLMDEASILDDKERQVA